TSTTPTTWTIGQLAGRAGVPSSTLRYYERAGLLTPVARTEAGYRLYDDTSEQRLRFVAKAKRLGCTLEEIADLVDLVDQDRCQPVQSRLHDLVTDKLAAAHQHRRELVELTADLQAAATHLAGPPVDGPCDDHCACHGPANRPEPQPVAFGRSDGADLACSLEAGQIDARIQDWRDLLAFVIEREPLDDDLSGHHRTGGPSGIRLVLDRATPADRLLELTMAEQGCCSFFSFAITVDTRGMALEVRAPDEAIPMLEALFGPADATDATAP
ncbi:MAG: MerR family transcriptional regulator, partial [Actinomycetota bacterium]